MVVRPRMDEILAVHGIALELSCRKPVEKYRCDPDLRIYGRLRRQFPDCDDQCFRRACPQVHVPPVEGAQIPQALSGDVRLRPAASFDDVRCSSAETAPCGVPGFDSVQSGDCPAESFPAQKCECGKGAGGAGGLRRIEQIAFSGGKREAGCGDLAGNGGALFL